MSRKIAFIGLGAMGQPMAANIQRKGTHLTVFDTAAERMTPLAKLGATLAGSAAEAARDAEIVITMLPATKHVEQVLLGEGGVADAAAAGAIIMDMSTIAPTGTDKVAAELKTRGFRFVDAPVGRLVIHAEKGEFLFMVGGEDDEVFETVRPLLESMGTTIHRCGAVGTGIRAKIVNNFMLLSIAQITAEGILLAAKLGLDIDLVKEINGNTSGTNGQFQVNYATKVLVGDTSPGFTLDLAHKDMSLALEAADAFRLGLPVGAATHAVMGLARSSDYAGKDFTALLDFGAEMAGIEPPRLKKKA